MRVWTEDMIAELTWWRVVGLLSFRQCARRMGRTRGSTAMAIKHHIEGVVYDSGKKYPRKGLRAYLYWTENHLTEPYAARKLRLQQERSQ